MVEEGSSSLQAWGVVELGEHGSLSAGAGRLRGGGEERKEVGELRYGPHAPQMSIVATQAYVACQLSKIGMQNHSRGLYIWFSIVEGVEYMVL